MGKRNKKKSQPKNPDWFATIRFLGWLCLLIIQLIREL